MPDLDHQPSKPLPHVADQQTGCNLKRKRPPGLEIPNVLREIRPDVAEHKNDAVSFSGSGVGVFSVKGKKRFMEDAYKIVSFTSGIKGFFGVYDGHGGRVAADFVANNLHTNIFEMLKNHSKEEAVRSGYLKTDQEFLKQGLSSGACCVTALIKGEEIVISNLGDCRAILCRGGLAEALTKDHRAGHEDERSRIERKGGYVEMHKGAWRVHGVLSVSRSIGDAHLKEWLVAEPDTKTLRLTTEMEYLVLASDGLWEKVGNQEAINIVTGRSQIKEKPGPPNRHPDGNDDKSILLDPSPSSKSQRASLIKQQKNMGRLSPSKRKIVSRRESGGGFRSENECPPLKKARRVAVQYSDEENSNTLASPCALVGACRELVNLALSRGSLDDITVMVIDLKHIQ